MTYTKEQIERLLTEGRMNENQPINPDLAMKAVIKGSKRLADWTKSGRDKIGLPGDQSRLPRGVWIAAKVAVKTGKLYGKPLVSARRACVRHAGQLAKFANTGSPL